MSFSGALKLTDLNDFLAPSTACILPSPVPKAKTEAEDKAKETDGEKRFDY